MDNFLKLVLRVLKTVLKNQKNLIFKNRLKHLKRKCFSVLGQKQYCSHEVKNVCKNLQRFSFKSLKPFCLSSEQDFKTPKQQEQKRNKTSGQKERSKLFRIIKKFSCC